MEVKQVGENIKVFLESRQIRKEWVAGRMAISNEEFVDVLEGKESIEKTKEIVTQIQKVFGIKHEDYFMRDNFNYKKEESKREPTPKFDFCIAEEMRSIEDFGEQIETFVLQDEAEKANEWYRNKQFQDIIETIQSLAEKIDSWKEEQYNEKIKRKG